jgi:hypothetical protein
VISNTTKDKAILKEKSISSKNAGIGKITIPSAAIINIGVPKPENRFILLFLNALNEAINCILLL